ncbi:low molecular weight protein-tyrosine-phosphatase [Oceanicoccus sp. KOV_DT_Chl]|uniref:low molecular weight protein-tyrosine-phosphatase n=1 Tax=Oceanicoccus sp. KOV_DT_Chl TaxID=1904639 RepID=UPI00190E65BA|nr:low molecular weight protein-tyrosine-phosphatase [Oceanicoccus sp. KOV_DT_Chl]
MPRINVLFVCLGNICRSPTAHGVFQQHIRASKLEHVISVDSAGTGDWHVGKAPDQRSVKAAATRGYDLSALRARQVCAQDFYDFDYILAMDNSNLSDLQTLQPNDSRASLSLLLSYGDVAVAEVPDPYYGAGDGFQTVLDLIEQASSALLQQIINDHQLVQD